VSGKADKELHPRLRDPDIGAVIPAYRNSISLHMDKSVRFLWGLRCLAKQLASQYSKKMQEEPSLYFDF
jgi:hypothetical protein